MIRFLSFLQTVYRQQRRQTTLPRMLTYTVTFTCNARCIMCDSWKIPSPNDLKLDEVDRIFAQLPRMDAVRLTGGEPFARRDMIELAEITCRRLRPLVLHVTTNGFLTDRIVEFCEKRPRNTPLHVLVSIDGLKEKHNHVRGHQHAWDHVMETLGALAPRRRELRLHLAVNQTVVDAEGAEHYALLREALRPLGVNHHMVMAYDTSATYNLEREIDVAPTEIGQFATYGQFTPEQLRSLFAEVRSDLRAYPFWERIAREYYLRGIENRLLGDRGAPNPKCVALTSHLRIFPNGDVPTCQFNSKVVGNLRQQPFAEVWRSATCETQREWVRRCPGCWAECEVVPSAIYTADLLLETLRPKHRPAEIRPGQASQPAAAAAANAASAAVPQVALPVIEPVAATTGLPVISRPEAAVGPQPTLAAGTLSRT